ncbi:MAG: hypothetical protein GX244_02580 [Firmicutes bacterium]|jgi:hypothetical protein|nr:hypothetical protein [Bacillota bacterium]
MLVQKSEMLLKLIEQRREIQENAHKVGGLRTRHRELQELLAATSPLVHSYLLLRQNNICETADEQFVENLTSRIKELSATFANDPETLNQAHSLASLKQSISLLQMTLGTSLEASWQRYVDSKVPTVSEDLMGVLGQIPAFSSTVRTVRELLREIALIREDPPGNQSVIDNLLAKARKLTATWQKLGSDDVPPAVLQFLRQAVTSGAPLSTLTPEVSKWLYDYGVSNSFKIRLSNEGS